MTTSLRTTPRLFAIAIAAAAFCTVTSSAGAAKPVPTCKTLYAKWQKQRAHKAIATTGGKSVYAPGTACGFSDGYPSQSGAINRAMNECQKIDRRFKVQGKCKIIKVK